ncbi:MAG: hypothetical protein MUF54_03035 [Polyangiaceae bacterium]|nr:hypothetical protein [Polyangiaceae bacterium]
MRDVAERLRDDAAGAESAFVPAFAGETIEDHENELLSALAQPVGSDQGRANELLDELERDWQS